MPELRRADLRGEIDDVARATLDGIEAELRRDVLEGWPVDTGRSLAAWSVERDGLSLRATNAAPYASYVREGAAAAEVAADVRIIGERLRERIEAAALDTLEIDHG